MPFKAKTSPVIRATLDALETINRLQEARLAAATDDAERARIQAEHHQFLRAMATILHEAQFGPPTPAPIGPRIVRRDGE